jgi:membrane protein CcdC involved in cytochrome C biogenesis
MFWILAFGMIVPWRIAMYLQYRKLYQANRDLTTNSI